MRVAVYWFGRPGSSPYEEQVEVYRPRVRRRGPAVDVPLRPAAAGRGQAPERAQSAEAEAVRRRVDPSWPLVALDERGRGRNSEAFARVLAEAESAGRPGMAFVVGSDLGLAAELRRGADLALSLSSMTLPHLLARLVLWEQLFRATHILGGGGYHRRRVQ